MNVSLLLLLTTLYLFKMQRSVSKTGPEKTEAYMVLVP